MSVKMIVIRPRSRTSTHICPCERRADAAALRVSGEMRVGLRLRRDGMKDVTPRMRDLGQGPERGSHSFYFSKFRHERWAISEPGLSVSV